MQAAQTVLPLVVLMPLGVAALLIAIAHWLPARVADVSSIAAALTSTLMCAWLAQHASSGPITHWFGGWSPDLTADRHVVLGIAFVADAASAAAAAFCAGLFTMSFVFAWGYFDEVHSHFHVLMLLFMAAMIGFCLTHDLFNLFVFFELMSVAAYALTAYPLGQSSLEGAFNFIVMNSLASFLLLAGVGLLYARFGVLDFTMLGLGVSHAPHDVIVQAAFCLIAFALLTKGAILPFHLWLADAHAVAPSPVSVIFSGAMVSLGLLGLAKISSQIFGANDEVQAIVHGPLHALGLATAIVGGTMAWGQRHLKRLLAFSTVSHLGVMLVGISSTSPAGVGGFLLYAMGHGLAKAALFMIAGTLLARCQSIDEIALHARGRALWPAGVVMLAAGLLLGGLPIGWMHAGSGLIREAADATRFVTVVIASSSALTGAAVVRAGLRIFIGASGAPGPERRAPTEREHEKASRPLALMLAPAALLVGLAFTSIDGSSPFVATAASRLLDPATPSTATLHAAADATGSIASLAAMLALVGASLARRRPTRGIARVAARGESTPWRWLEALHSGLVADYVTWSALGLAGLATYLYLR